MRFVGLAQILGLAVASECPSGTSEGTRITGTAYKRAHAGSPEECCALCSDEAPTCAAWVFYKNHSAGTACALKAEAKMERTDEGCVSGRSAGPAPAPTPVPGDGPQFNALFTGGAVLQHGVEVPVWGTGAKGTVTLSLDGDVVATAQSDGGNWSAKVPAQGIAFNRSLTAADSRGKSSTLVSFGMVVLCSGQSNMGMPVVQEDPTGFQADNGTAEAAAASRYTGRISLLKAGHVDRGWFTVTEQKLYHPGFSAVCWYSGRQLSDHLGSETPVGLIMAAVGGSPIEFWISPEAIAACEVDEPQCDDKKEDSVFYHEQIQPLFPYALGAVIWDQAERDVKCPKSVAAYPCLQKQLISTWRSSFASSFVFVAVQLHGYTAALKNGTGSYDGGVTAEMVYNMRLAQEEGTNGVHGAAVIPTYDLSCPTSPFSSVHIPDKADVGARVALQLRHLLGEASLVAEGPRATVATAKPLTAGGFEVAVTFAGGTGPFELRGTRNCTSCCDGEHSVDLDMSADGSTWINGTAATLSADGKTLTLTAQLPGQAQPAHVRHTAASIWPQCALYNGEGFPAMPFSMDVVSGDVFAV